MIVLFVVEHFEGAYCLALRLAELSASLRAPSLCSCGMMWAGLATFFAFGLMLNRLEAMVNREKMPNVCLVYSCMHAVCVYMSSKLAVICMHSDASQPDTVVWPRVRVGLARAANALPAAGLRAMEPLVLRCTGASAPAHCDTVAHLHDWYCSVTCCATLMTAITAHVRWFAAQILSCGTLKRRWTRSYCWLARSHPTLPWYTSCTLRLPIDGDIDSNLLSFSCWCTDSARC